jgi:hypothetical protein
LAEDNLKSNFKGLEKVGSSISVFLSAFGPTWPETDISGEAGVLCWVEDMSEMEKRKILVE